MNGIKIYQNNYIVDSERKKSNKELNDKNSNYNTCSNKRKIILTISIIFLIIILTIIGLIIFYWKPWEKKKKDEVINYKIDFKEYQNELIFNTKVKDTKRISINQKSYEDLLINGIKIQMKLFRKTIYDIHIISEKDCDQQNKKYCNKTYNASVAMVSECISLENENCEPKQLVDLLSKSKKNLRNLNELKDLKDISIYLCLFNITDTNIIISISCPESLHKNSKNKILSDLNYFRPLAKYISIRKDEFNVSIQNKIKNIRRISNGLCDIKNNINSFCGFDINITKDSEGNLISYNETFLSNITASISNGFNKYKITNLIDETSQFKNSELDKYKSNLDYLLNKLNPYLKNEENFPIEKLAKEYNKKNKKVTKIQRFLTLNDNNNTMEEESIFNIVYYGAEISLNYKIDSGINNYIIKSFLNLNFDDEENELVNLNHSTNINKVIKTFISIPKSGNYLAFQIYKKLTNNLNNLTQQIMINISNLNNLIEYKNLTEIFDLPSKSDAILILPLNILEESDNLINKLNISLKQIENGSIQNYSNCLYENINNYFNDSFDLMNKTFFNLNQLGILLNSQKNKFTEISNIYLNNSSNSYASLFHEANNIYLNYGQKENNMINYTIELILDNFENIYLQSIQNHENMINNLNYKLQNKNLTIENAKEEDYEKINRNLNNSNSFLYKILNKIKEEIKKNVNNKTKDYFLSENIKDKFNNILNEINEIVNNLDNEIIDKKFNQIMINFKDNFTNILGNMNKIKEDGFYFDDIFKEGLINLTEKENIKSEIFICGINILNDIKNEINIYEKYTRDNISKLVNDNVENLNDIISDLNILLTEISLKELSVLYEIAFNSSLNKINNDILYNKILIEEYYNDYNDILSDKKYIFNNISLSDYYESKKKLTQGYLRKYNIYNNHMENIKKYINNELYNDLIAIYNNILFKLKEKLQIITNEKIVDSFPGIEQLDFTDKHNNKIDYIYNIINIYFSLEEFNSYYLPILNDFKSTEIEEIENITYNIEYYHNIIMKLEISEDNSNMDNDMCILFSIEMIILGQTFYGYTDEYCTKIEASYDNYNKLIDLSIDSDENLQKFSRISNNLISSINVKVEDYISNISMIKNYLLSFEQEINNQNETIKFWSSFENKIDNILSEKYEEKLIKRAYSYYKNNIEGKIENIFICINKNLSENFDFLIQQINKNLPQFKNSFEGLNYMSKIYKDLFANEIINNYFDSIINLQKNEFNYTISYCYNYLINIVNSTHLYIINNITSNNKIINSIINLRKKEINEKLNELLQKIMESKNEFSKVNRQINILKVEESNFFELNTILTNEISYLSNLLNNKIEIIDKIENYKLKDEFSITSNLYLEISENEKQINEIYKNILDKNFIELNHEQFNHLIKENFIIDKDEIITSLKISIYNSNKELLNDFLFIKENYSLILEKEINKYFTKKNIIENINNLYKSGIKELEIEQIKIINNNVNETIQRIKDHLYNEARRINISSNSYTNDFFEINNTIKSYKENIFEQIKSILINIIDEFKENMINKIYKEYIEKGLNQYRLEAKKYTKCFKEYELLNSTYNLKDIIENIIEELVYNYKDLSIKEIDYQYKITLKNIFDLDKLKIFIEEEINNEYNSNLFPILIKKGIYHTGDIGYNNYDLSDNIKNDIITVFKKNIDNIKNIFLTIKGNNYQVDILSEGVIWKNVDFSQINLKFLDIENNFESFILSEKNYEENYIIECLKKVIKSNFNNSIYNILSSFGFEFFQRELKYNQIFRISNLYNNFGYYTNQTMSYYLNLNYDKIGSLPKELKEKIISLNNIELLINKNNNYLIQLLNSKIEEFINNSKYYIIDNYLSFLKIDDNINSGFNKEINQIINYILNTSKEDLENDYIILLNSFLNENFIDLYNLTLKEEKEKIFNLINILREKFISEKGELFSLISDNFLEEINIQNNKTLGTINEYYSNLDLFQLSEELLNYLNNFEKNNIKPIYEEFTKNYDEILNNQIVLNFEKKLNNYENSFNSDRFINYTNNTLLYLKNYYIDNINDIIINYYNKYNESFDNELNKLIENKNKEDEEIIYGKPWNDTFQKLIRYSENSKSLVVTLKEFDDYKQKITTNINNLNIAYKESQKLIHNNNYEEEININFNNRLLHLKEISLNYYNKINDSYDNLKNYLIESIQNISNEINNFINITNETLINEYKKLYEKQERIDIKIISEGPNLKPVSYSFTTEDNTNYNIDAVAYNIKKYTKFQFGINMENNNYKNLQIFENIINKNSLKNLNLDVYYEYDCVRKGIFFDIIFNDSSYIMNIDYDSKINKYNLTTISNFEKYDYTNEVYEIEDSDETECYYDENLRKEICQKTGNCGNKKILSKSKTYIEKKESIIKKSIPP